MPKVKLFTTFDTVILNKTGYMHTLIYLSKANKEFAQDDIIEIAAKATAKNKSISVTGFLTFRREYFVQFLEGEKSAVQGLMKKISTDERHTVLKLIEMPGVAQRNFTKWNMRYISNIDELKTTPDDTLIEIIKDIDLEKDSSQSIRARIFTRINKISRVFYLPPLGFRP